MLEWLQVMLAYRYLHQRGVERHSGRSQCKPWSGTGLKGVVTTTGRDMHTLYSLQPDKPLTVHRHTLTFHPHAKWLGCAAQRHTRKDTHTHRHTQYGFHQHHRRCGVRTHTSAVIHGCTGTARGTHTYTCTYIRTHTSSTNTAHNTSFHGWPNDNTFTTALSFHLIWCNAIMQLL